MKKIISLFLTLATVILAISACAGSADTATTAANTTAAQTTASTTTASTSATKATTSKPTTQTTVTAKPHATPAPAVKNADPESLVFHLDFSAENLVEDAYYKDLSGNGHVGYVYGSPTQNTSSVSFDGSGSSYVWINDHSDLNFHAGQSYTLEIRFKAAPNGKWGCLAQKGLADGRPGYLGFWMSDKNTLNMGIGVVNTQNLAANSEIDTEWHQAVIIQDTKTKTVLFYLDGVLQNSTYPKSNKVPVKPTKISSVGERFTVGSSLKDHFNGEIAYVKLYNYAVPETEILSDYSDKIYTLERKYYEYTDAETNEKFTLPYRAYYPTGYKANDGKKYPVFLALHGHGECGKDNTAQLRNSVGHVEEIMAKDNCIVLIPQCECDNGINKEWVASNHSFDKTNRTLTEKATLALRAVMALMEEVKKDPAVDTDRISAFGFSMGGFGVWELLIRDPDTYAAAIILSAAGIPSEADKVLDIDIRAYHGRADATVPVSGLQLMDDAIKALGGTKFSASYFVGVDHNGCINSARDQDGDIFGWLISQTKAD